MFPPTFEVVVNQPVPGRPEDDTLGGGFNLSQDAVRWMSMNGYDLVKEIIKAGDDL